MVGGTGGLGKAATRASLRVLRVLGQILAIFVICLVLDYVLLATVFSRWKQRWADAASAYTEAYIKTAYDHDLAPNSDSTRVWGNIVYPWHTDRYGFRIGTCAPGEAEKSRPAIFVIGDSFTEAIGSSYENSFAGLMACDAARQGKAVWNLGVASYSPAIYHRKIRVAAQKLGITPREIYVFLDLSDIDDDANVYHVSPDGIVTSSAFHWFNIGQFLLGNFATFRLAYDLYLSSSLATVGSLGKDRARWTVDPTLMKEWGQRGLEIAARNLDQVVAICREWDCSVTLVVYPWPDSIASGDRNSIQVTYWRDWSASHHVRFIDGFAAFFREPSSVAIHKYFIAGDVHFSAAGHRLLFDELKRATGGDY
ncbi:GDSL-like Lipase/Acylhydrolase family [Enhydrobacter aerosaccus]|uniref:GDSL-like Lipase/Acylhydrolase family n=1 Tax=Enhydrobacter aerosaccus TaxID=225324 RepID=A0A1T4PHJ0_9HYPH|nr:SGNH/GDSL hydrolase family protein [Enhydrobacter aerosaccus]SJZ90969.1 GDSL-like Lipase/Acylhydrolase family [Enhydrobacter aerosaccus]